MVSSHILLIGYQNKPGIATVISFWHSCRGTVVPIQNPISHYPEHPNPLAVLDSQTKSSLPRPTWGPGKFKCEKWDFPGRSQGLLLLVRIWAWGKWLADERSLDAGFSRNLLLNTPFVVDPEI